MTARSGFAAVVVVAALIVQGVGAEIRLPAVFSKSMVLQRDRPLPVWGTAEPGETVIVSLLGAEGVGHGRAECVADAAGRFRVTLDPLPASSAPLTMRIEGSTSPRVVNDDVLVGEVWLCGGQSNMEWPLERCDGGAEAIAAADHPRLRVIKAPHRLAAAPEFTVGAAWSACTPATARAITGVGYFFARELERSLDVPVGLLSVNWGGTRIEPWIAPEAGRGAAGAGAEAPKSDAPKPDQHTPGAMYDGMIAPFVPYAIRGVIWYQGESNAGDAEAYRTLLPRLIESWRERWGEGDFPFGIVQLANFRPESDDPVQGGWALLRDAQLEASQLVPNTGLVVTIDVGDAGDIHPRDKKTVGERLAAWALATAHGKLTAWTGPTPRQWYRRGAEFVVCFDHASGGLATRDGAPLGGFAIAGADGAFAWADARIEGDRVVLAAPGIIEPTAARYAWSDNPAKANLVNGAGLPASPFRTDRPARRAE